MPDVDVLIFRAQAAFDVHPAKFSNHRVLDDDTLEARACAAWALRELGLEPKEIGHVLQYHDHQRPLKLIAKVEKSPRLLARARKLLEPEKLQ